MKFGFELQVLVCESLKEGDKTSLQIILYYFFRLLFLVLTGYSIKKKFFFLPNFPQTAEQGFMMSYTVTHNRFLLESYFSNETNMNREWIYAV